MEALVNDCWGVRTGAITPGGYSGGNVIFKFYEKVDVLVCRPCIKEDGMPYSIVIGLIVPDCQTP